MRKAHDTEGFSQRRAGRHNHGRGGNLPVESVAAFAWNRWQACYGISGSFRVERVAALPWNQWQDSPGIGGSFAVEYALKHYYAKLSLFQHFQSLCMRMRHRLQQTRFAFLLPPKARAKGRFLSVSRQVEWGLQTLAYLEMKERERSPEATALALALRGIKPFKMFLTPFVRNTTCLNEVMKMVKTQGLSTASMQACQERLSA